MKIVTCNVPISYIKAMDAITQPNGPYPSRSELVRAAVKDYIIEELPNIEVFRFFNGDITLNDQVKQEGETKNEPDSINTP